MIRPFGFPVGPHQPAFPHRRIFELFGRLDGCKNKFEYTYEDDFDVLLFGDSYLYPDVIQIKELKKILEKRNNVVALFITGENIWRFFPRRNFYKLIIRIKDYIFLKYFPGRIFHKIEFLKDHPGKFFGILTNSGFDQRNFASLPYFLRLTCLLLRQVNCNNLFRPQSKNMDKVENKKFCAFAVNNPSDLHRIYFYKKLSKYRKVDSYGRVLKNCEHPKELYEMCNKDSYGVNRLLFKKYKFVICFENTVADDYVTEKLLNAVIAGTIPIYRGAGNVGDYFNTDSFINYHDYGSYDKMIEKVIELDNDDDKYREFLQRPWFTEKNLENIEKKHEEIGFFFKKLVEQVERNRQRK